MNPPSEDIKDILIGSSGLGYTFGTDLFIGEEPDGAVDDIITISDTGGWSPDPHIVYDRPTIQILVRNTSYLDGYSAAEDISNLMRDQFNVTINSTRYIGSWMEGAINHIGYDSNKRVLFSMNFNLHRTA